MTSTRSPYLCLILSLFRKFKYQNADEDDVILDQDSTQYLDQNDSSNMPDITSGYHEEKLTTIVESPNIDRLDKNNGKGTEESKSIRMASESKTP